MELNKKGIHFIPQTAGKKLLSLTHLHLNDNEITEIPKGFRLEKLKGLYLANNPINHIDVDNFFEQFPQIEEIYLSGVPNRKMIASALKDRRSHLNVDF